MNNNPYREPAEIDLFTPAIKERLVLAFRAIVSAPGRWWGGLADGYRALTILAVGASLLAGIVCAVQYAQPCARIVVAKVHGVTPEGLPADYDQSWCAEYKPGRRP
jgi:hypothetical protein